MAAANGEMAMDIDGMVDIPAEDPSWNFSVAHSVDSPDAAARLCLHVRQVGTEAAGDASLKEVHDAGLDQNAG